MRKASYSEVLTLLEPYQLEAPKRPFYGLRWFRPSLWDFSDNRSFSYAYDSESREPFLIFSPPGMRRRPKYFKIPDAFLSEPKERDRLLRYLLEVLSEEPSPDIEGLYSRMESLLEDQDALLPVRRLRYLYLVSERLSLEERQNLSSLTLAALELKERFGSLESFSVRLPSYESEVSKKVLLEVPLDDGWIGVPKLVMES